MKKNYGIWLGGVLLMVAAITVAFTLAGSSDAPVHADDTIVTARCGEIRAAVEPFEDCIDQRVITDLEFDRIADLQVKGARGSIAKPNYSGGAYIVESYSCHGNFWDYEVYRDGKYPNGTLINRYIDDCKRDEIEPTATAGAER